MQIADAESVQSFDCHAKRFARVGVSHIVERSRRGDSNANALFVPHLQYFFRHFSEEANTVRSAVSINVAPLIRPSPKKLIDQIAVCCMNLDPIESGLLCVRGSCSVIG